MATLYGHGYTRRELLELVGDISQVARAKPYRLADGFEDGVLAVDLSTGSGLELTVLPSRGLDVSAASHRGRSLAWRSATTDQHPAYFEPEGLGWLRSFYGGLVSTCGLTYMGAPCEDEGRPLGLHGRMGHTPATNVHWDGEWIDDNYVVSVSGKLRESAVFGENVQLTRRIWARLGESRFFIDDVVENMGHERTPHMMLYHINMGFPVVACGTRLLAPSVEAAPRDDEAARDGDRYSVMDAPTAGYSERVFFHDMRPAADGCVTAALVNDDCEGGFGAYVRYSRAELPYFTEWKMMGQGTYVVGMEPGNALVLGRAKERQAGRLEHLSPGEKREYHIEIGVLEGRDAIARMEEAVRL